MIKIILAQLLALILTELSLTLNSDTNLTFIGKSANRQNSTVSTLTASRKRRQVTANPGSDSTSCFVDSEAIQCLPPFQDLAHNTFVHASSTCGENKVQQLCRSDGSCSLCDVASRDPTQRFTSDRLTDGQHHDKNSFRNIPPTSNQTCWASGVVRPGDTVNLTVSFGKRFEVYYVTLQPCLLSGSMPDSIAIYKSSDFGIIWHPWHYFSVDCYRAFGLPTTDEHNSHITSANLHEVLCVALQPPESFYQKQLRQRRSNLSLRQRRGSSNSNSQRPLFSANWGSNSDWAIAFSTTLGRPASRPWSPTLIDWMTVTDLRIVLMRFPAPSSLSDYRSKRTVYRPPSAFTKSPINYAKHTALPSRKPRDFQRLPRDSIDDYNDLKLPDLDMFPLPVSQHNQSQDANLSSEPHHQIAGNQNPETTVTEPKEPDVLSDNDHFAFSHLAIGGRCKCNGHASECLLGRDGRLRCVCEHDTEGDDCERCKPGYMDRPWDRATTKSANTCMKCDCNLHSDECRFSNALYLVSNRMSGGVCENCQHHTAGRNCQHCSEGYYRDWSKPISHEKVCIPCRCHPIGSIVRHDCDRRSGQCRCKQGVTGLACDRCQEGYHQTRSPVNPCTKDILPHVVALAHTPVDIHCVACSSNKERMRLKKFCRKDAVLQASFKSRELHGNMAKFEMHLTQLWRFNRQGVNTKRGIFWPAPVKLETLDGIVGTHEDDSKLNGPGIPVWVRLTDLRCKCPEIELGISYLIVTDFDKHLNNGHHEFLFTSKTAILPWRPSWRRRLVRFRRRENRGACERLRDKSKLYSASGSGSLTASARRRNFPPQRYWYSSADQPALNNRDAPTIAYGRRLTPSYKPQPNYYKQYYSNGYMKEYQRGLSH